MIQIDVDIDVQDRIGSKAKRGVEKYLLDGAQVGQNRAMEEVAEDRGTLRMSLAQFVPELRGQEVVWGTQDAPHALPIERGTRGFYPPLQPLLEWSKRVTGDTGLGYYVARVKIPEEGIDANPFLEPGAEAQASWYSRKDISEYIQDELR